MLQSHHTRDIVSAASTSSPPQFLDSNSRRCSVSDASASVVHTSPRNSLARDAAAASVSCGGIASHGVRQSMFLLGFRVRRRNSGLLALPTLRASSLKQPPSEPENDEAEEEVGSRSDSGSPEGSGSSSEKSWSNSPTVANELNKAVRKTAATFAPRASTASKNPASPGSTLYTVFEAQAYVAMVLGGALSFNLLFPSDNPDIWRLMGMWSIWMFTVPSLRARDCSKKEKEALNYLFLVIPLVNVTLPLVWRSFAAVWSADVLAFFAFYAWKMEWFSQKNEVGGS